MKSKAKVYSVQEERINVITHALGTIFGFLGMMVMWAKTTYKIGSLEWLSLTLYSFSLIVLFGASTLYHSTEHGTQRERRRIFDHAAIFGLIAGTYSPVALITLRDDIGVLLFGLLWGMAAIGICLKVFLTGRFNLVSTLIYIVMGWTALFVAKPIWLFMDHRALMFFFIGGVVYTLGAFVYAFKVMKMNHAFFHWCVLVAAGCHYWGILRYIAMT